MIFRHKMKHAGIILFRLTNDRPNNLILFMQNILKNYTSNDLSNNFVLVTEKAVRIIKQFEV